MTPPLRVRLPVAGVVAGAAGIVVSLALTLVMGVRANPLQAFAEVVIAKTPGPVAESLIHVVGRYDKPLLVTGVTVGILVVSGLAGVLAARSSLLANVLFLAMGVLGFVAVATRPGAGTLDVLPDVVGTMTWMAVLAFLGDPAEEPLSDLSRRRFLVRTAGVVVAATVVGVGGRFLGRSRRAVEASRSLLRLPVTPGVVPAGANVGPPGVTPWRVDNADFYRIDTALVVPAVDPDAWVLRIHGLVQHPLEITYRDLLGRRLTEAWVTLCCVSNPVGGDLIGNAWWSGVRVADLLAEAGVSGNADAVRQTSHDGWTCGTPLSALTDGRNAMLAVAMNGQPLPVEHGFPVRMVVPGLYGYVSATKWVVDLEVTRFDRFSAYWVERGWSEKGPVKTESRIDVPRSGARPPAGTLRVGGSAWAQHTGIERVEYRLDGQPWRRAELGRVPGADTWVQWTGTVEVGRGEHRLAVRATDRSGYTQTPVRRDVVPDGATGWHSVTFDAQ